MTIKRYFQTYRGTDYLTLSASTLVLDSALYDALAGNASDPLEYFVDVTVGGIALDHVTAVTVTRALEKTGQASISFATGTASVPGVAEAAEVIITAGIKRCAAVASQVIFRGTVDIYTAPNPGEIQGSITARAYDYLLSHTDPPATVTGDVGEWLQGIVDDLGITGLQVVTRGTAPVLTRSLSLTGYASVLAAVQTVACTDLQRYVFSTGSGEITILDPAGLASEASLFTLKKAIRAVPVTKTSERFNRIPFSNYCGYAHDIINANVTVNPDGTSTVSTTPSTSTWIEDVYNDAADQADYGILESSTLMSPVPTTVEEFEPLAASFAAESQRLRVDFSTTFNPFADLGTVCTYDGDKNFISEVRHYIRADAPWTSEWELREL